MNVDSLVIDGFGPLPAVRPATAAELGEGVRRAASENVALYPFGGGTKLALGNPPTKKGLAVDMSGLAHIVDFPARDMTVTVQAGITMKALQDQLRQENLRLPIDVADTDRATLGGIVAANVSGPRRHGFGTLRDYVIGISAVNDLGNEFKAGGRVVKNVAGYDICKLLVGSLGTLGIITQVTLKLRPLAEEQALVSMLCESADLEAMLLRLHESRTRPVCLDLLNRPATQAVFAGANLPSPDANWVLLIGYEGNADAVQWQVQQLVKEIGAHDHLDARVGFTAQPLWEALVAFGGAATGGGVQFKANLRPSAVASFCRQVDGMPGHAAVRAHAGTGIVQGAWKDGLSRDQAAGLLASWRDLARAGQGSVVAPCCPADWKTTVNVWGPPPESAWLMREIKAKFDPKGIFNPGRFVAGI